MGQAPITYIRQVVSGAAYPEMLSTSGNNNGIIPEDASAQAQRILDGCGGKSLGAYSNSAGVQVVREDIARFVDLLFDNFIMVAKTARHICLKISRAPGCVKGSRSGK